MSLGPLRVLTGVGGREQTKVMEGDEEGHILLSQGNKVQVLKLSEACILQTWFASANQTIVTGRKNQDNFENCTYLIAYDGHTVARVNNLGSKLAAFNKQRLDKNIFELLVVRGDHYVVFTDGSIGSLQLLAKMDDMEVDEGRSSEEGRSNGGVLEAGEELLDVYLQEDEAASLLFYIVEKDGRLVLLRSRLGVQSDLGAPVVTSTSRFTLGTRSEIISWDIYTGEKPYMVIWKKSGEILYSEELDCPRWREVFRLDNCYDADIVTVSPSYFAVMFSQKGEDIGSLKLISIPFHLVSSETNLKTTIHKGRGLFFVSGYLFVVGGGRIAFSPVSDLHKQLDQYIGMGLDISDLSADQTTLQLYVQLPRLFKLGDISSIVEVVQKSVDVPEDLVLDLLHWATDNATSKLKYEEQRCLLREVFNRDYSQQVLQAEIARLRLDQSLQLLEIICTLLEDDLSDVYTYRYTERLVAWITLLVGNHYVQTVLSKDGRTLGVLDQVYRKVVGLEAETRLFTELEVTLHNLSLLPTRSEADTKLPYSIQILEL